MTAAKSLKIDTNASYRIAAALRRAKLAAKRMPLAHEVRPTEGKIQVVLSGKPIPRTIQESQFGPSSLDIPEFALAREKLE